MVHIVDCRVFDLHENFIINLCDCDGEMNLDTSEYPHVRKEMIRYINHQNKNGLDIVGTCQYVPTESYALVMVDTIKNNMVDAYDKEYQYIVNLFCRESVSDEIDFYILKNALLSIKDKAQALNASIAIQHTKLVEKICYQIFNDTNIEVLLCKGK